MSEVTYSPPGEYGLHAGAKNAPPPPIPRDTHCAGCALACGAAAARSPAIRHEKSASFQRVREGGMAINVRPHPSGGNGITSSGRPLLEEDLVLHPEHVV